jgi:hypothetical protein
MVRQAHHERLITPLILSLSKGVYLTQPRLSKGNSRFYLHLVVRCLPHPRWIPVYTGMTGEENGFQSEFIFPSEGLVVKIPVARIE